MKRKRGVDWSDVHPSLWQMLALIDYHHEDYTGNELVVTSLRRPPGDRPSKHAGTWCTAADLRRWYLTDETMPGACDFAQAFCRELQDRYGDVLGVVLEPEWLSKAEIKRRGGKVTPHIHVQLKRPRWLSVGDYFTGIVEEARQEARVDVRS